jgi:hypothetical protein
MILIKPVYHSKSVQAELMKTKSIRPALVLTGILIYLSLAACAPKCIINGRVVDAETQHPIKGAAVAIRWVEDQPEGNSAASQTFDSAQDFSDNNGYFNIPGHPDKNFVMGVYKEGYICWSNRSRFADGKEKETIPRQNIRVADGMQVRLEPLKAGHSQDQHASFTVLVAEEVTESKQSPFYNAIKPLFKRWRDNLRKQFRKTFGQHKAPEPD